VRKILGLYNAKKKVGTSICTIVKLNYKVAPTKVNEKSSLKMAKFQEVKKENATPRRILKIQFDTSN